MENKDEIMLEDGIFGCYDISFKGHAAVGEMQNTLKKMQAKLLIPLHNIQGHEVKLFVVCFAFYLHEQICGINETWYYFTWLYLKSRHTCLWKEERLAVVEELKSHSSPHSGLSSVLSPTFLFVVQEEAAMAAGLISFLTSSFNWIFYVSSVLLGMEMVLLLSDLINCVTLLINLHFCHKSRKCQLECPFALLPCLHVCLWGL